MTERYDELVERARSAFAEGDLDAALACFHDAEELARNAGDAARADEVACHAAFVETHMGRGAEVVPRLKRIFMRNADDKTRWTAAYNVAVALDTQDDPAEAREWALRSTEIAERLGDPLVTARCNNLAGALALRSSDFATAEQAFRRTLSAHNDLDGHHAVNAAQVKDNIGYTLMCTDRLSEGITWCETARSELDQAGAEHLVYETLQDLCYGYLLDDRLDAAQTSGERALALAVDSDDQLVAKNCLFLLSEVAVRRGDTFRARRYLRDLAEYYPEVGVSEEIIDVFLATDLTTVVNLRA